MKLLLVRLEKTANSTSGELYINDDVRFCYTLELPWRNNAHGISCIPLGTYDIDLVFSEHFQRKMPMLRNVPDRNSIEIHNGSYPRDTHGCIMVGFLKDTDFIGESKKAFGMLLIKIALAIVKKEPVTIEIMEA